MQDWYSRGTYTLTHNGVYSITKSYLAIIGQRQKMRIADLVWTSMALPRHRFMVWLAIQGRLLTQERKIRLHISVNEVECSLCDTTLMETNVHLFKECSWIKTLWQEINLWTGITLQIDGIKQTLERIKMKHWKQFQKETIAAIYGAVLYHTWRARNGTRFKERRMAMLSSCKRLKVEGDTIDRLTDLPINVKHLIQENLLIEEAARMSVLSSLWRHVWASIPKLVFSAQFCQSKPLNTLIDIINTILSQHCGAIKTFFLTISSIPNLRRSVMDEWMFLLSKKGIKELTLQNTKNVPYKLPSFMYDVEIEKLHLSKCVCRLPCSFRGFYKLKFLTINLVLVRNDGTSILWMPNLLRLHVVSCQGLYHLKIYAPKLWYFNFYNISPYTLNLAHFLDCRNLKTIIFGSKDHQSKVINLTNLLSCCPQVSRIFMDSSYLKSFASGTEVERLPTRLDNVNFVGSYIDFDDEDQVFSLLRILRSTPNVEELAFVWNSKIKGGVKVDVNHFEEPAYSTQEFNKLQKLKIVGFRGLKAELLFVRFILRSAPLLLKTILKVDESVHESQYLKISEELMGFPQASPKLEIICKPQKQAK